MYAYTQTHVPTLRTNCTTHALRTFTMHTLIHCSRFPHTPFTHTHTLPHTKQILEVDGDLGDLEEIEDNRHDNKKFTSASIHKTRTTTLSEQQYNS